MLAAPPRRRGTDVLGLNGPAIGAIYGRRLMRFWAPLAAVVCAACASAQPALLRDPLTPQATIPAFRYESVFSTYRSAPDQGLGSWRAANDQMWRLGGHMGHIEDAPAPSAPVERRP